MVAVSEDGRLPKAYSYLRFSTPEQAKGDSSRRQLALTREYAARHSLELDEKLTFHDLGISAFRGLNAETGRLGEFLQAVKDGVVPAGSFLLVESLDRISRQAARKALRALENIVEGGITVVTLSDGKAYTTESIDDDPMSLMLALMIFIRSNEESATKSRRLKSAWSNKRQRASTTPLTARAPAWLELSADRKWMVRPDRAAVVRRIYRMAADGIGEHAITQALNREGVLPFGNGSRLGVHWHRTSVIKILENPAVGGVLQPYTQEHVNGRKVRTAQAPVAGHFPIIVDEETRTSVAALRTTTANPQRGRHASQAIQNVFGGLARCPICNSTMTRVSKGSGSKAGPANLVCTKAKVGAGCRYRPVRLETLEKALQAHARWLAATGPGGTDVDTVADALVILRRRVAEGETRLARLVDAVAAGLDSPAVRDGIAGAEVSLARDRVEEKRLVEMHDATDQVSTQRRLSDLENALSAGEIDRGRVNVLLRQLMARVVPQYGTGLIEVEWKAGRRSAFKFSDPEDLMKVPPEWRVVAEELACRHPLPNYAMTKEVYDRVNPPTTIQAINDYADRLRKEWDFGPRS